MARTINSTSSGSITWDSTNIKSCSWNTGNTSSTLVSSSASISPSTRSGSGGCNESLKHNNEQKALFHGLKSAYRMSREYDGTEYGTADPPWEAAARTAANVALAFFRATDHEYDREESFEYLRENVVSDPRTIDRVLSVFGIEQTPLEDGRAHSTDLENGIAQAWKQVDAKENHGDGARTALAIAEAYLGEEFDVENN